MEKAGKMIFKKRKEEKSLLQDFSVFNMPICTGNLQAEVRGVIICCFQTPRTSGVQARSCAQGLTMITWLGLHYNSEN